MKSLLHTGASLLLKVQYEDGKEKVIGFCTDFSYTVSQGQKLIYTVDRVVPVQIAQGAGPTAVRGSMNLYLPKGCTLESLGLVSYRQDAAGDETSGLSKSLNFRIYDRLTGILIASIADCKLGQYSLSVPARGIVRAQITFDGTGVLPGPAV